MSSDDTHLDRAPVSPLQHLTLTVPDGTVHFQVDGQGNIVSENLEPKPRSRRTKTQRPGGSRQKTGKQPSRSRTPPATRSSSRRERQPQSPAQPQEQQDMAENDNRLPAGDQGREEDDPMEGGGRIRVQWATEKLTGDRFQWGICTNPNVGHGIAEGGGLGELIFRNLNLGQWYSTEKCTSGSVPLLGFYGACIVSDARETNPIKKRCLYLAETLVPYSLKETFATQEASRQIFADTMVRAWGDFVASDEAGPTLKKIFDLRAEQAFPHFDIFKPDATGAIGLDPAKCTAEKLIHVLEYLATHSSKTQRLRWIWPVAALLVAYAKRGNIRDRWLIKFKNDLGPVMGNMVEQLEKEFLVTLWNRFSGSITDDNAEKIFTKWISILPPSAIRLVVTLRQASGSGLTSLDTVAKSMKQYPDFPWAKIGKLYRDQYDKVFDAFHAVGTNRYFGFRSNLGPATSTNFKDIAWIAKELLIRIGGDGHLASFGGWIPTPSHHAVVEKLIADYVILKRDQTEGEIGAPTDEQENEAAEVINVANRYCSAIV